MRLKPFVDTALFRRSPPVGIPVAASVMLIDGADDLPDSQEIAAGLHARRRASRRCLSCGRTGGDHAPGCDG